MSRRLDCLSMWPEGGNFKGNSGFLSSQVWIALDVLKPKLAPTRGLFVIVRWFEVGRMIWAQMSQIGVSQIKAPTGSIFQKYVYSSFMVNMRIDLGSFGHKTSWQTSGGNYSITSKFTFQCTCFRQRAITKCQCSHRSAWNPYISCSKNIEFEWSSDMFEAGSRRSPDRWIRDAAGKPEPSPPWFASWTPQRLQNPTDWTDEWLESGRGNFLLSGSNPQRINLQEPGIHHTLEHPASSRNTQNTQVHTECVLRSWKTHCVAVFLHGCNSRCNHFGVVSSTELLWFCRRWLSCGRTGPFAPSHPQSASHCTISAHWLDLLNAWRIPAYSCTPRIYEYSIGVPDTLAAGRADSISLDSRLETQRRRSGPESPPPANSWSNQRRDVSVPKLGDAGGVDCEKISFFTHTHTGACLRQAWNSRSPPRWQAGLFVVVWAALHYWSVTHAIAMLSTSIMTTNSTCLLQGIFFINRTNKENNSKNRNVFVDLN